MPADSPPSIPGLVNVGNTCYLNAALQALAASSQFTACIATLAAAFEATAAAAAAAEPPPTLAQLLSWGLRAAARFVWEGPVDESPPSHDQLIAQAAQGRLTRALHAVLSALQPAAAPTQPQQQQQQQQHQASPPPQQQQQLQQQQKVPRRSRSVVHPGEVLSCLSAYLPQGLLEVGRQQDAAEALVLLLDAINTELACWHKLHSQGWSRMQAQPAGLSCLLGNQPQLQQQQTTAVPQQQPLLPQPLQLPQQSNAQPQAPLLPQPPLLPQLPTLPHRLPVMGCCWDEITCLECGDSFECSASPYSVLPLALPLTPQLIVPPGTTLTHCLGKLSRTELVRGVECTRCSLQASLEACRDRACSWQQQREVGQQQQKRQQQTVVEHQQQGGQQQKEVEQQQLETQRQQQQDPERQQANGSHARTGLCDSYCCCAGRPQPAAADLADTQAADASEQQQQQQQQQRQCLQSCLQQQQCQLFEVLHHLAHSQQPLPPLDYQQLLRQQLQQHWIKHTSPVTKRSLLGRAPPVLLLQLQRSAHVGGVGAKIQGHVAFPLQLDWGAVVQQQSAGNSWSNGISGGGSIGGSIANSGSSGNTVMYSLVAVVQHLGLGQSSGHYVMYRWLPDVPPAVLHPAPLAVQQVVMGTASGGVAAVAAPAGPQQQLQNAVGAPEAAVGVARAVLGAAAGNGLAPSLSALQDREREQPPRGQKQAIAAGSSSSSDNGRWLRVSDSNVKAVSVEEVLMCQATLLVYEQGL